MHQEKTTTLETQVTLGIAYERPTSRANSRDDAYDELTCDNSVLLLIDHQVGPLWELEMAVPRRRAPELARAAAQLGVPTIVTLTALEEWGPLIRELALECDEGTAIVRTVSNAWHDANVRGAIEATERPKLIVAGSGMETGVVPCAIAAARAGYHVFAPMDASGTPSNRAMAQLARAGVVGTTVGMIVAEWRNADRTPVCSGDYMDREFAAPRAASMVKLAPTTLVRRTV